MSATDGIATLHSFAPGWGRAELLEQTLVGRRQLVDRLVELVRDGAGGPNKHQRLIVGVRGSGKTHVLRVLHNRLWRDEALKERLVIIFLLEDELGLASFLDLVVRMLRAIVRWYPERTQLTEDLQALYHLPLEMQEGQAVKLLLQAAEGKDVLVLMENLGLAFDQAKGFGRKGQQAFRNLVQQHPCFMIFASSQALVEGTRDPDAPFYGFFKTIHLKRLTLEEAMDFLRSITAAGQNEEAEKFLGSPQGRGRMRAIYRFTGGNHRLLVTFYDLLTTRSVAKASELFSQALNPLKPYYQEQMRSLSAQQQKIIHYLCLQREPQTVKSIARGCFAAPNTVSSQLKGLYEQNYVSRIQQGRESYYEIAEALFRICYEADLEQQGAPVRLFVDFLANLYTAEELRRWSVCPHNPIGELLGMGRVEEALAQLPLALAADRASDSPTAGVVVQSLHESCMELLEHAPSRSFAAYLEPALEVLAEQGYLDLFEQSLPVTVMALIKKHESISEERYQRIVDAFEQVLAKKLQVGEHVRLLQAGIGHFKKKDRLALLRLTREERLALCEHLGIDPPR